MPDLLVSLLLLAASATFTPGPGTLLAAVTGAQFGFRRTVPLLAGIAVALFALMAATAGGLAMLLQPIPGWQLATKVVGSIYLLWLAWKIGRSVPSEFGTNTLAAPAGFRAGVAILCLNPKAWTMALGAAAAYAGLASGPLELAVLLGAVFGGMAALALSLWCVVGLVVCRSLRATGKWRVVNAVLGLVTAASVIPLWL